jgi:S-adenosylmethionine synthetase
MSSESNLADCNRRISTAEYVMDGHPDKLCDIVADSILDEYLLHDPAARVACEILAAKELIVVAGEISSEYTADIEYVVRRTLAEVGYVNTASGISANDCRVVLSLSQQSPSLGAALCPRAFGDLLPAGDQAVVTGFATRNDFGMIPPASFIAKTLAIEVGMLRHSGGAPVLLPDGKTLACIELDGDGCVTVRQIVISAQHRPDATPEQLSAIFRPLVSTGFLGAVVDGMTELTINPPSGRFCFGGPAADTGLTGRKIVADSYGPNVPQGGGSFSGKDPTKIDRCGAYAARWIAKSLVTSGVATTVLINLTYVIGSASPIAVDVVVPNAALRKMAQVRRLILEKFDLRPGALIERLALARPLYSRSTSKAHFGIDSSLPWEQPRTDI